MVEGVFPDVSWAGRNFSEAEILNIVVKVELVRMRSHPHRVRFIFLLVVDPEFDELLGEDPALS